VPFVHVHHDGYWFINEVPANCGIPEAGYAYVEISEKELCAYRFMQEQFANWQDKLYQKVIKSNPSGKPFERYFVDGIEQPS
jgi:hypothetical protein